MNVLTRSAGVACVLLLATSACRGIGPAPKLDPPVSWNTLQALPLPASGRRIEYGEAGQQFGELRLPEEQGQGPFPVVVILHGGCWLNAFDYEYITRIAARLTRDLQVATWTVEFRRIGDPGGGWPGTFLDVGDATDHLRGLAIEHRLDLSKVVTMGHSAGGHLALWLATRHRLPTDSALYRKDPLAIRGVVGLAAITDLAAYRIGPEGSCHSAVDELIGGPPSLHAMRYAQASPRALLPLGVPQWLVQGAGDPIVPAQSAKNYVAAAVAAGDKVELMLDERAGHFDPVAPDSVSWPLLIKAVEQAVR
ncbi:MAG: alpha/beta hydrolase [Panacagrimonas sp.]